MKIRFTFLLWASIVALSSVGQETSTTIIPIDIIFPDTFHFEFGYFGDEEGMVLEQAPLYAQYYELSGLQWELRTFHYQPQDPLIPSDTSLLIEFRGSDGAGPSMFIDTTIIVFNPLIDAVEEQEARRPLFWPNPNSGEQLYTSEYLAEYNLFNAYGALVQKGRTSENGQVSMAKHEMGLYYLVLAGNTLKIVRL